MAVPELPQDSFLCYAFDRLSKTANNLAVQLHKNDPEAPTTNTQQPLDNDACTNVSGPTLTAGTAARVSSWIDEISPELADPNTQHSTLESPPNVLTSLRLAKIPDTHLVRRPNKQSEDMDSKSPQVLPQDNSRVMSRLKRSSPSNSKPNPLGLRINKLRNPAPYSTSKEVSTSQRARRTLDGVQPKYTHRFPFPAAPKEPPQSDWQVRPNKIRPPVANRIAFNTATIGRKQGLTFAAVANNRKNSSIQTGEDEQEVISEAVQSLARNKVKSLERTAQRKSLEKGFVEVQSKLAKFGIEQENGKQEKERHGVVQEEEEEEVISPDSDQEHSMEGELNDLENIEPGTDAPSIQLAAQNRTAYFQERAEEYADRYAKCKPLRMELVKKDFDYVDSDVKEVCKMAHEIHLGQKTREKEREVIEAAAKDHSILEKRKAYFQERAEEYASRYAKSKPLMMDSVRKDFEYVDRDISEVLRMAKVIDDARKNREKKRTMEKILETMIRKQQEEKVKQK